MKKKLWRALGSEFVMVPICTWVVGMIGVMAKFPWGWILLLITVFLFAGVGTAVFTYDRKYGE